MKADIDHIKSQIQWWRSALSLRVAIANGHPETSEAAAQLLTAQERVTEDIDRHDLVVLKLVERFGLQESELKTMWLLVSVALSSDIRRLALELTGDKWDLSTAGVRQIVHGSALSRSALSDLSPDASLVRLGIIEMCDGSDTHESRRTWTISKRVLEFLHGESGQSSCVRRLLRAPQPEASAHVLDSAALERGVETLRRGEGLITASGPVGTGRRMLLRRAAKTCGQTTLDIDATRLSRDPATFASELRDLARECVLLGSLPLVCNVQALQDEQGTARLDRFSSRFLSEFKLVLLTSGPVRPVLRSDIATVVLHVRPPTTSERAAIWHSELGEGTMADAEYLATQYPVAPALIHQAARSARTRANGRPLQPDDIYAGIRAVLDDKLGDYARRVDITQSWDDVVLPEDQMEQINYLIARIRQRRTVYEQWGFAAKVGKGLGTSALFSGPPGTGKTMICALIAKELGLDLYQVDMAKITSKYIGETERNLAALFDAAEAGHAILLFDEADSLFGKRTDVKSSNDRYANLETNYLLQRLESFTGICLLTSNHESAIDQAFMRRLSLHLRFELPEAEERAALWEAMLPAAAPVAAGVDFVALAKKYVMSGGYIRNAALRAAFMAADEGSVITGEHLARAAKLEYEGMGKIAA